MPFPFTKAEVQEKVDACPRWYHQIQVGHGIRTPGGHSSWEKLKRLQMPEDLSDWSVLDIGANDGFFSFQAEKRGAERVLAVDGPHWTGEYEYIGTVPGRKQHFETARELRNSKVEDLTLDIYDISPEAVGTFDLVLCLGVLYHLAHITRGLENAIKVTNELIIVESAVHRDTKTDDTPQMIFTPEKYARDGTNWWYPNVECLKQMMLTFGCADVKMVWPEELKETKRDKTRIVLHGYMGKQHAD
jgi:tRNA (mo5U34)-methyltransferase